MCRWTPSPLLSHLPDPTNQKHGIKITLPLSHLSHQVTNFITSKSFSSFPLLTSFSAASYSRWLDWVWGESMIFFFFGFRHGFIQDFTNSPAWNSVTGSYLVTSPPVSLSSSSLTTCPSPCPHANACNYPELGTPNGLPCHTRLLRHYPQVFLRAI